MIMWKYMTFIVICLGVIWLLNASYLFSLHVNVKNKTELYHLNMKKFSNFKMPFANRPMGMWTYVPAGDFGSFMSQYATLLSLSQLNGHQTFMMPAMHDQLARVFKVRMPVIDEEVANQMSWKIYKLQNWMSPTYYNIIEDYVKFFGNVSSWAFYHHIREEIRQEFSFHDFIKDDVYDYFFNITESKQNVTYIGVHVFMGNYGRIMLQEQKGVLAIRLYVQRAMTYFRNKCENPIFVVTSNDMDWCRESIDNLLGDVHFAGDGNKASPMRDFALLAHCNHTIMTMGTFGFWAAYLAGGWTTYLTNLTLPNSGTKILRNENVLPEWIGIPADLSPGLLN